MRTGAEPKHRPRPGSAGVLSVAILLLVAGCAGHAARTEGARTALDHGRPKEALRLLNEELGPEYEVLLELLAEAREGLRASGRSTEDVDWQRAFDSGIVDLVRAGRVADAKELLNSCL